MGVKLQALLDLQDIELQIVDIRRQIARHERRVASQSRKLTETQTRLEAEREQIRRQQMRFDELDVDLKGRNTNIDRLREHLNTVRTNKEYAAVLAQMNNEKADSSRLETQALEVMEGVDSKKQELAEIEKTEAAESERLVELEDSLAQARESFAGRLQRLEKQKSDLAATIERKTVDQFNRLSQRHDGEVMSEVERPNPRRDEFICGGCHMSLRAEVANALKIRDDVITCKNCGRILYIERHT